MKKFDEFSVYYGLGVFYGYCAVEGGYCIAFAQEQRKIVFTLIECDENGVITNVYKDETKFVKYYK